MDHLQRFAKEDLEFDTKEMMSKFSLEVVASTGFGVEANAFSDPDGIFSDRVSVSFDFNALQSILPIWYGHQV